MARSLQEITVAGQLTANLKNTLADGESAFAGQIGTRFTPVTKPTSGTSAHKADRMWESKDRALASGASETIDLFDFGSLDVGGGAGRDAAGQLLTQAEVVGIEIQVDEDSTGTLLVGGDGTAAAWNSPFNGDDDAVLSLGAGGYLLLFNPADPAYAVADTSNHLLKLAAAGGAVTFSITILGRSA